MILRGAVIPVLVGLNVMNLKCFFCPKLYQPLNESCFAGITDYEFHYSLYEKGDFYPGNM
jgi:hypothetical protein